MSAKTFSLDIRKDGIGILTMDVPGESMNTLKAAFADEIRTVLAEIKGNRDLIGLVIASGKKDSFIAGADISMLAACTSAQDAETLSREGQIVFAEIEALTIPVIASGGLGSMCDIEQLCAVEGEGVQGVICGRAIYSGDLDFAAAQARADALKV